MSSIKTFLTAVFLLPILLTSLAHAQIRSATIAGTVHDASGAVIAAADIALANQETGITASMKTAESGQFAFPYLPAGLYTVTVTSPGFNTFKQSGINLSTAQTARVDITLKLSSVDTTVEVQAQAATIQTDTTSVSGGLQARAIDAIPNITQNPLYYAFLQAGVQPRNAAASTTNDNSFGIGVNGRRQFSAVGINGGRAFTNDVQLDGLPVMGGGYNEAAVIPNTEGLQEVKVISNNFSAEYGRGQGVISMSTKSGTNAFHGQGTYTLRNEGLNANTNSNNANNIARNPFKQHEFGGALTGPIIKNKLFFSSSFHYLRFNRGTAQLATVPTARERVGDFSQTLTREVNGLPVAAAVYNPFNVVQEGPDLYRRAAYANAIMPNDSPAYAAAVYMYSFYPLPNRTPDDVYNLNNYVNPTVTTIRRKNFNNRVDYKLGRHSIYGSAGFGVGEVLSPRPFGTSPFNGAPNLTSDSNPYVQIGDTVVLAPTLLLDVRYGVTRINAKQFAGDKEGFTDYDKIGVPKNLQALMQINGAAPVVANYSGGNGGGSNWTALTTGNFGTKHERQMSHVFSASMTKMRGRWTHKFGGEFRNLLSNYADLEQASVGMPSVSNSGSTGNFNFEYTNAIGTSQQQNVTNQQRGVNGATMFTGAGLWWIRPGANLLAAFGQPYYAFYSQNDWRATSKLTVNLGMRWDLQPGPTERYNRMASYDFEKTTPFGSALGTMAFPGTNGYNRGLWDTRYNNFGPRLGLAYQAMPGLVIRGGFGVTYLPSNTGYFSGPNDYGSTSFGNGTNMIPYGTNPQGVPAYRFYDPNPLSLAVGANVNEPSVYGVSEARFDRHLKNGVAKQWNIFMEKSLKGRWFVSAGYSASASRNLSNRNEVFQSMQNVPAPLLAEWKQQYIASNGTLNPATQLVANPLQPSSGTLRPFTGAIGQSTLQRYVQYLPNPYLFGGRVNNSRGFADYQSMQLRLSHAFASGFQMDLNYTWSKGLDYTSTATEDGQGFNVGGTAGSPDILNLRNNRKYGAADSPHRFTAVMVYELPFGPGKALAPSSKLLQNIVGNWQVGSVITLQSGMPIVISGASDGALVGRPNRIAGVPIEVPKNLQKWYDGATQVTLPCGRIITPQRNTFLKYNACAFEGQTLLAPNGRYIADQYWVGTSAQNFNDIRTPGRTNVDLSLRRTFRLRESVTLNLVADATNLLNNAQYSGAYTGALGATNLVDNPARGLKVGMGSSDTFGTIGVGTFDPRQVTMRLLVRF